MRRSGTPPIVARISLRDLGSRNLKDQDLTPAFVTRSVSPLQRKSVISSRLFAGAVDRPDKDVREGLFHATSSATPIFGVTLGAQNMPFGRRTFAY